MTDIDITEATRLPAEALVSNPCVCGEQKDRHGWAWVQQPDCPQHGNATARAAAAVTAALPGRHEHVRRPTGELVMALSVSASDRRSVLNAWSIFRRAQAAPAR